MGTTWISNYLWYRRKKIKFHEKINYGRIDGVSFENNIISTCVNDNIFNILRIKWLALEKYIFFILIILR